MCFEVDLPHSGVEPGQVLGLHANGDTSSGLDLRARGVDDVEFLDDEIWMERGTPRLIEHATSGWPYLSLTRRSIDSVEIEAGCVEFVVGTGLTIYVEVEGVESQVLTLRSQTVVELENKAARNAQRLGQLQAEAGLEREEHEARSAAIQEAIMGTPHALADHKEEVKRRLGACV